MEGSSSKSSSSKCPIASPVVVPRSSPARSISPSRAFTPKEISLLSSLKNKEDSTFKAVSSDESDSYAENYMGRGDMKEEDSEDDSTVVNLDPPEVQEEVEDVQNDGYGSCATASTSSSSAETNFLDTLPSFFSAKFSALIPKRLKEIVKDCGAIVWRDDPTQIATRWNALSTRRKRRYGRRALLVITIIEASILIYLLRELMREDFEIQSADQIPTQKI